MGLNIGPSGIPGAINKKCEQSHYLTCRSRDDKQSMIHFLTHWGKDKMANILQTTFSDAFC